MAQGKRYLGESGLQKLIEMIKAGYAKLVHSHTISDITDYTVDSEILSDSKNPVQNKVIKAALDGKVPKTRTVNGKSLNADILLNASDVGAATPTQVNTVQTNLDKHIGNESVHFTETERTKLSGIAEGAQKNTVTGVKGSSESTYRTGNINITKANIGLSNVNNTSDANKPVSTAQQAALDGHNTNASAHNDIRLLIEDINTKLMNFLDLGTDESTGKEVIDSVSELVGLYEENADLINSITTSKVNVSDIIDNLTTASTSKVLSANQGVEIKKLIDALQTTVNGKANSGHTHDDRYYTESEINTKLSGKANTSHGNHVPTTETANNAKFLRNDNTWQTVTPENIGAAKSSHGTHVSYSTTAPVMDGTASVGSAGTVARSDHKHPTDTSRASKTEFDTHTSDTTKHITSTERTNWNSAKTHADSAHAPSDAQKNQNAFSNIKVGSTTISADNVTDTLELVGSNVTITPDATNDKVTIAVAAGTTSQLGIVKLENSTSSTSTETAATPSSVKSAYDLANTAKTNAANAQTRADNAYNLANSKVDSLSDLGITATATELNKLEGVTSNIQTQLNSKATIVELTKEEYDALGDAVLTDGKTYFITDIDGGSGGSGGGIDITELTQEEYNALSEEEKSNGVYVITDANTDNITATGVLYDGSETGLGNTVQGAIDSLNSKKPFTKTYYAIIGNVNAGADFYYNSTTIENFDGFTPVLTNWYVISTQYQTWINIVDVHVTTDNKIAVVGRNDGAGTAVDVEVHCVVLYIPY